MRLIRRTGLFLVALALLLGALVACNSRTDPLPPRDPAALRLASHNVHYIVLNRATGAWSVADWEKRRGALTAMFRELDADLVAFQEMESFAGGNDSGTNLALDWLLDTNPGYGAAAVGDPRDFPSTQPILYRRDRLSPGEQGWFFFSDTPDVIYSRTFNGSYPAFASWVRFTDGQGRAFRVVNLHLEYKSRSNRLKSAELVADRITPWVAAGEAVFVVGDFNALAGSATLGILEDAGITFWPVRGSTYHFDRGIPLFGAIDHLGAGPGLRPVTRPVTVHRRYEGQYPSDHYPVVGDFLFQD